METKGPKERAQRSWQSWDKQEAQREFTPFNHESAAEDKNMNVDDLSQLTTELVHLRERVTQLQGACNRRLSEARRATEERDRLRSLLDDADEVIAASAPLAWVAKSDMDGAGEWEVKALRLLDRIHVDAAAPKPEQPEADAGTNAVHISERMSKSNRELIDYVWGKRTPDEVSTDELTDAEITIARTLDALRVNPDGCGFVPRTWLARIRAFRDRVNQQPEAGGEEPDAIRRHAAQVGLPPPSPAHDCEDCNGTDLRTPDEPEPVASDLPNDCLERCETCEHWRRDEGRRGRCAHPTGHRTVTKATEWCSNYSDLRTPDDPKPADINAEIDAFVAAGGQESMPSVDMTRACLEVCNLPDHVKREVLARYDAVPDPKPADERLRKIEPIEFTRPGEPESRYRVVLQRVGDGPGPHMSSAWANADDLRAALAAAEGSEDDGG